MSHSEAIEPLQSVSSAMVRTNRASLMTAVVSACAFVFSAFSMWNTSLKSPELKLYAADNISYLRDPWGSYEVVVAPLTIVNSGARDGAIVSLELEVHSPSSGRRERFLATYTVDAGYFGATDDVSKRVRRPKLPFAPLSVAGRSAYTGTILFYGPEPKEARETRLLEPQTKVEMTLRLVTPNPDNWLDRLLGKPPQAMALKADVPAYMPGAVLSGDMARLRLTEATAIK
jgi:hypothetical protein